jgi:hypothetical protein
VRQAGAESAHTRVRDLLALTGRLEVPKLTVLVLLMGRWLA